MIAALQMNQFHQKIHEEREVIINFSFGFLNEFTDFMSCTYLGGVSNVSF
jgi:hypothetical protein